MSEMNGLEARLNVPSTPEWREFREGLLHHRTRLERALRRELVHDARAARCRVQNIAARDLADEALCQTLDEWRSKPSGTPPFEWMLKRGLHLLDAALDREALAAESRAEGRDEEQRLRAVAAQRDDEERARWLEVAELAGGDEASDARPADAHQFDRLESPVDASSPDARMQHAETILAVEQALLRLPEVSRRAVAHRYLDGLDLGEIAYILDLERGEVEVELTSALRVLRKELRPAV